MPSCCSIAVQLLPCNFSYFRKRNTFKMHIRTSVLHFVWFQHFIVSYLKRGVRSLISYRHCCPSSKAREHRFCYCQPGTQRSLVCLLCRLSNGALLYIMWSVPCCLQGVHANGLFRKGLACTARKFGPCDAISPS
jgi:hypothetical protein